MTPAGLVLVKIEAVTPKPVVLLTELIALAINPTISPTVSIPVKGMWTLLSVTDTPCSTNSKVIDIVAPAMVNLSPEWIVVPAGVSKVMVSVRRSLTSKDWSRTSVRGEIGNQGGYSMVPYCGPRRISST